MILILSNDFKQIINEMNIDEMLVSCSWHQYIQNKLKRASTH